MTPIKKELIKKFKNYLTIERGLSQNSIDSYLSDLRKLDRFLDQVESSITLEELSERDIQEFLREETEKKRSSRTRARVIASLRQFYNFLEYNEIVLENPMKDVETPRIERNLPDYLTKEEVQNLFTVFDENNPLELRDKTIFEILYSTGMRISEAVSLKISDIDLKNMTILVLGKGNRERLIPFGEIALELIQKYIREGRPKILKKGISEVLFVSKKGGALSRKSVWRLLKGYMQRGSVQKNITPHTLRHSFATHLLQNQADLRSVQELLGHIDISTTQIYTHLVTKELAETHNKFHPRSQNIKS